MLRPGRPRARRRGLVDTATREDYLTHPGRVQSTRRLKPNCKRPHLPPSQCRFRVGSVSTRIEAPLLSFSLSLSPSPQHLLFLLLEIRHVMVDNSTLYFRIHRLRSNAWDHGSGPVKAACRQSVVLTREARPFLPEGLRVQLMFEGTRSPCRSYQSLPVRAEISFPAQSFVSRSNYRLAPVLPIWTHPFCIFVSYCRGGTPWQW